MRMQNSRKRTYPAHCYHKANIDITASPQQVAMQRDGDEGEVSACVWRSD